MRVSSFVLRVADLQGTTEFYTMGLGFCEVERTTTRVGLSASGRPPSQITLVADSSSVPRSPRSPGLYHLAFLFPDRPSLGRILRRIVAHGHPLQGAAHHLVSEAIYLADPEGNGLELYRDLPEEFWPRREEYIEMGTEPLDVEALYEEGEKGTELDPSTRIGHIHLQVSDLARSRQFYEGVLGLRVTQQSYPGALFLSSEGYHHHIALNTWRSSGCSPVSPNALGLDSFSLVVPPDESLQAISDRGQKAGCRVTVHDSVAELHDPDNFHLFLNLS